MKIIRNSPQLELTEKEYHLLEDTWGLIYAIDSNLTEEDWACIEEAFPVRLEDVKDVIEALMHWSKKDLYRHLR